MKFLVVLAFVAVAAARPGLVDFDHGSYKYEYHDGLSTKAEVRTPDGLVRGGYNYVDDNGDLQKVQYTAGAGIGFRVAATNLPAADNILPLPVQHTPEVLRATNEHLDAWHKARLTAPHIEVHPDLSLTRFLPVHRSFEVPSILHAIHNPTQDTLAVQLAKAEHFAAHEKQRALVGLP